MGSLCHRSTRNYNNRHLTSLCSKSQGNGEDNTGGSSGSHIRFRLTGLSHNGYAYHYPLSTESAWANPVEFTEVFLTCDPGLYLTTSAPVIGKPLPYDNEQLSHMVLQADPSSELTLTSTLNHGSMRYPTAWHRLYSHSNPPRYFRAGPHATTESGFATGLGIYRSSKRDLPDFAIDDGVTCRCRSIGASTGVSRFCTACDISYIYPTIRPELV